MNKPLVGLSDVWREELGIDILNEADERNSKRGFGIGTDRELTSDDFLQILLLLTVATKLWCFTELPIWYWPFNFPIPFIDFPVFFLICL